MNLDNLTKKQITTLIRCLHETIIQTNKSLSKMIITDEDDRHFNKINKHFKEVKELYALFVAYKNEKWGMREVKFKAWLKEEKRMVEVEEINLKRQFIKYKKEDEIKYADFDDIELLQYIGLKDKNGVEIYEGDIIKANPYGNDVVGKVCYTGFAYEVLEKTDDPLEDSGYAPMTCIESNVLYEAIEGHFLFGNRLEVIGNIYENPELLEK